MAITFYATNNFTGDGTTVNWNINFADGYIDITNVKARYLDNTGSYVDIAISSVVGNVVTISPAVASGQEFQIYRDTEKRFPLVDFSDGAILNETNLDTLATQAVMVSAEAFDQSNNGVRIAGDSLVIAQGIDAKAQLALDNSDAAVATANAIDGKAQTALDSSAAAVVTANAAASTASGAATIANTALTTANDAADDAATAITTANGAVTMANAATTTANAASAAATAATTTANNAANDAAAAVSTAGTALSTANTASTNASTAVSTANDAKATAEGIEAKADSALAASATAVSTANSAEATANAIDGKAQTALDTANSAVSTANSALSTVDAIANTKANKGANSDITSLSGLTTALSVAQGGTGATTAPAARTGLGLGTAATRDIGTSGGTIPLLSTANTWAEVQTFSVPLSAASGGTGNANGTVAALTTARNIQTNLSSTAAASFDGTSNVTPGVTGVLPVAMGGTGVTTTEQLWPLLRPFDVLGNAGRTMGLPNGIPRNHIWLWNSADTPDAGYANFIEGGWFDSAWRLGGVRSGSVQLSHAQLTVDGAPGPAADFKFYPDGTAQATNWSSTSDPRVKSLVEVIPDPLDLMRSIRGYSWYYEHTGSKGFGFLSSEVKVNFSGAVKTFGDAELPDGTVVHDVEGVDVSGVSAALHHEAILALMDRVAALEARIDELTSQ